MFPTCAVWQADEAPLLFPKVGELLVEHGAVAFEIDDLLMHPPLQGTTLYQKGIVVVKHESELIEVGALSVGHPGLQLTSAGLVTGWFYRANEVGEWVRERHPDECRCGNDQPHREHVSALHIIEDYLANPASF